MNKNEEKEFWARIQFRFDSFSICIRLVFDLHLICIQFVFESYSIRIWFVFDSYSCHIWEVLKSYLRCIRRYPSHIWVRFDSDLISIRLVFDSYSIRIQFVFDSYSIRIWFVFDSYSIHIHFNVQYFQVCMYKQMIGASYMWPRWICRSALVGVIGGNWRAGVSTTLLS